MSLKLNSSGGGSVTLQEPVTASNLTLNLPSAGGTVVAADGSGNVTFAGTVTATSFVGNGSALTGIAGGFSNMQVFTSSGSWTVPAGITKAKVTVIGGGGGGGGTNGEPLRGGGGGGGGGSIRLVTGLTPGTSVTVTVGAGGTAANDTAGGTGGTSSFGAFCSATGGAGGARRISGSTTNGTGVPNCATGAAAGTGSSGDINMSGTVGFSLVTGGGATTCPNSVTTINICAGCGGDSPFGLGFGGAWQTGNANGLSGTGFGGGGGGGQGNVARAGAAGQGGVVIVEW